MKWVEVARRIGWQGEEAHTDKMTMCECGHPLRDHVFSGPDEYGSYECDGCMGADCACPSFVTTVQRGGGAV